MTTRTLEQHRAAATAGAATALRELHRDPWAATAEAAPEIHAPANPMRRGRARFTHYRGTASRATRAAVSATAAMHVPSSYYMRLLADGYSIVEIVTGNRLEVTDTSPAALTALVLDELTALLADNPDKLRGTAHLAHAARHVVAELHARTDELGHAQHLTELHELIDTDTLLELERVSVTARPDRAHKLTHPRIAPTSEALTVRLVNAPGAPNCRALLG